MHSFTNEYVRAAQADLNEHMARKRLRSLLPRPETSSTLSAMRSAIGKPLVLAGAKLLPDGEVIISDRFAIVSLPDRSGDIAGRTSVKPAA